MFHWIFFLPWKMVFFATFTKICYFIIINRIHKRGKNECTILHFWKSFSNYILNLKSTKKKLKLRIFEPFEKINFSLGWVDERYISKDATKLRKLI